LALAGPFVSPSCREAPGPPAPPRVERFIEHRQQLRHVLATGTSLPPAASRAPGAPSGGSESRAWSAAEIAGSWRRTFDGGRLTFRSPRLAFARADEIAFLRLRFAAPPQAPHFDLIFAARPEPTRADTLSHRRQVVVGEPRTEFLIAGEDWVGLEHQGEAAPTTPFEYLFVRFPEGSEAALDAVEIVAAADLFAAGAPGPVRHAWNGELRDVLYTRAGEEIRYETDAREAAELSFGVRAPEPAGALRVRVSVTAGDTALPAYERSLRADRSWQEVRVSLPFGRAGAPRAARATLALRASGAAPVVLWSNPMLLRARAAGRPNVVLYVVDALRPDHLGFAGYAKDTSPFLDGLAARALVFRRAYAQATWTKPSVATLLTSLHPQTHGVGALTNTDVLPEGVRTLQDELRPEYVTAQFSANPLSSALSNLDQGFDYVYTPAYFGRGERRRRKVRSEDLNGAIVPWLEAHRRDAFFVYVHSIDPHQPFSGEIPAQLRGTDPAISGYDAEVLANDGALQRLHGALERLGLLDDTLFIVTSDHGEAFGEHGHSGHGVSVYEEEARVPLLMAQPGKLASGVREDTVGLVDVMPSVLAHCGLAPNRSDLDGRSVLSAGGARPVFLSRFAFPRADASGWAGGDEMEGVVDWPFKLIVARKRDGTTASEALFDLAKDPLERRAIEGRADVRARLRAELAGFQSRQQRRRDAFQRTYPVAAQPPAVSQDTLERLRALGYIRD
jgi:arylsulfatase A-like enzyme